MVGLVFYIPYVLENKPTLTRRAIVIKVERFKSRNGFLGGVLRPNCILDVKTDRNWEGVLRPKEKSGELKVKWGTKS